MSTVRILLLPVAILALAACGGEPASDEVGHDPAATPDVHPLASVLLSSAPTGAKTISALKSEAEVGQQVVLRGRVGGQKAPLVAGRAAMTVVDESILTACDAMPDDQCSTPWDFCCESRADLVKGMATIQVTGEDGKPRPTALDGLGGLGAGSMVVVTGTVAAGSVDGNLIVDASGIYPETPGTAVGEHAGHDHDHDHQH